MRVLNLWLALFIVMSLALPVGMVQADSAENNSRIQNLEVDLVNEKEARIEADSYLQDQIDNLPGGPAGGYVSVSFIPPTVYFDSFRREVNVSDDPHKMNGVPASPSVVWNGLMHASTSTGVSARYFVPVQLPDGAVITSFHVVAYDNDPDYDGRVNFYRSSAASGGNGYNILSDKLWTSGSSNIPQTFTADSIVPSLALVDNLKFSYSVETRLWGGTDVVMLSAVIGYVIQ